ncbi:MAG: pirin family protein [Dehalococcoidia bacterium]|nr:pirin family protein [Dehalococcoidia bacterium]
MAEIQLRRKGEIYHTEGGWFSGYWHFSFDQYYDPENTHFGTLRVFNVDTLVPGAVWPLHPHRDMEVVTYCVQGEFQHADNLGNDGVLYPGDVQHTTIGKGLWHSEINHSKEKPMTFIQVWVLPSSKGLSPSVEQRHIRPEERLNGFLPLVSNAHPGALTIQQDAEVYAATVEPDARLEHVLPAGYGAYDYLISGRARLNDKDMEAGDAAKIWDEGKLTVEGLERSEVFMVVVRV